MILKIEKERVLKAASICDQYKEVLEILFPEVFKIDISLNDSDEFFIENENETIYHFKVDFCKDQNSFHLIEMDDMQCYTTIPIKSMYKNEIMISDLKKALEQIEKNYDMNFDITTFKEDDEK